MHNAIMRKFYLQKDMQNNVGSFLYALAEKHRENIYDYIERLSIRDNIYVHFTPIGIEEYQNWCRKMDNEECLWLNSSGKPGYIVIGLKRHAFEHCL